jgi:putative ABC transport system permease protein
MSFETTFRDLRYAARGLRRNPGFATTAICSLAIGIGTSVGVFSVADGLLLRPLPYPEPDQLMMVWEAREGDSRNSVSPANYLDWKARSSVFGSLAAFEDGRAALADGGRAAELDVQYVSAELLPLVGVQPLRGRLFSASEDQPGQPDVVLISYRLWQGWFGGDEGVIGRRLQVSARPATVIGVMPPGFYFRNRNTDLWETLGLDPAQDYRRSIGRYLMAAGRLKAGVGRAQAQSQMTAVARQLESEFPASNTGWTVNVEPLRESLVSDLRPSILVLLGAVGLLLGAACANVANLLTARQFSRRLEVAIRNALGADRGRVIRLLLTESLAIGLAGGALGLAMGRTIVRGLLALAPRELSQNISVAVDDRIVLFACVISVLTSVLFGVVPSLVASRVAAVEGLREGSRGSLGGPAHLRAFLVGAEVAMSVMLLSGAGLLFRTLVGLQAVDPGLNPAGVLTFRVLLPTARYPDPRSRTEFFSRALSDIERLPGVEGASAVSFLPFNGLAAATDLKIDGRPPANPGQEPSAVVRTVMPGYFRVLAVPLKKGRVFSPADSVPQSPYRFVVNEEFVERYFPREDPLGQRISVDMDEKNPFGEIVGVVGNVKEGALDKEPEPTVYYDHSHLTYTGISFVVRAKGDPMGLADGVRRTIQRIDPSQPIAQLRTMESVVRETFARQRFSMLLMGGFSLASLLLAAVGLYGVMAYSVTERTREFGVRAALGAEPAHIVGLVLRGGLAVVLLGTVAGLSGALALSGLLKSLLFGVGTRDAATFAAVPCVLVSVALVAAYLPARRASRLAPVDALRAE